MIVQGTVFANDGREAIAWHGEAVLRGGKIRTQAFMDSPREKAGRFLP